MVKEADLEPSKKRRKSVGGGAIAVKDGDMYKV